jgi:hypothetical protein
MVELFRMLATELNWLDTDYYFSCMEYTAIIADLQNPAGNCSMSATGDIQPHSQHTPQHSSPRWQPDSHLSQ